MKKRIALFVCVSLLIGTAVAQAGPLPQGPTPPPATVQPTVVPTPVASAAPAAPPRSLPSGTIVQIDKSWTTGADNYLIVTNGQDRDAVVTLSQDNIPMMSVYVRAHESFNSIYIWHGTYTLAYVLGVDWDSAALKFTRQVQSDKFDQPLVFDRNVLNYFPGFGAIGYTYWKAYLGSSQPADLKSLEELGDGYAIPRGEDRGPAGSDPIDHDSNQ